MSSYRIVSAETMARRHPGSFQIPPRAVRYSLRAGDLAKLVFEPADGSGGERMWVQVKRVTGPGRYAGVLRNAPFGDDLGLKYGDPVSFTARNIVDITGEESAVEPSSASAPSDTPSWVGPLALAAGAGLLVWALSRRPTV